jgi:cellulose synthase (UDP-forming)
VATPSDPTLGIDPESTINLGRAYHFAEMPNLAYFVSAGFPFSRMADLSDTAVVLPDTPSTGEISAYLRLMGRFGYWTGYPVLRMTVARPEEEQSLHNDDILVLGTIAHLGSLTDLMQNLPVSLDQGQIGLKVSDQPLGTIYELFSGGHRADQRRAAAALSSAVNQDTALVTSGESPWGSKRHTVVAMLAGTPQGLDNIMTAFTDPTLNPLIQGDFSLLSGGQVTSFRIQPTYTVGWIPFWMWPSYILRDQPFTIVIVMIVGCVLLTLVLHATLRRRAANRLKAMGERQ